MATSDIVLKSKFRRCEGLLVFFVGVVLLRVAAARIVFFLQICLWPRRQLRSMAI